MRPYFTNRVSFSSRSFRRLRCAHHPSADVFVGIQRQVAPPICFGQRPASADAHYFCRTGTSKRRE